MFVCIYIYIHMPYVLIYQHLRRKNWVFICLLDLRLTCTTWRRRLLLRAHGLAWKIVHVDYAMYDFGWFLPGVFHYERKAAGGPQSLFAAFDPRRCCRPMGVANSSREMVEGQFVSNCLFALVFKTQKCVRCSSPALHPRVVQWYGQEDGHYTSCAWVETQKRLDEEWGGWVSRAQLGEPTGSSPPVTPPCRLLDRSNVDLPTPDAAIPEPMKKTQVSAAKRLQKELAEKAKAEKVGPKESKAKQVEKSGKGPKKADQKKKPSKKNAKKTTKSESKSCGPLSVAFQEFMRQKKADGRTHKEALGLWKNSPERTAIVGSMSESERKRRRY